MLIFFLQIFMYRDRVVGNLEHAWEFSNGRNSVPRYFGEYKF